jgi:hypothetical protein
MGVHKCCCEVLVKKEKVKHRKPPQVFYLDRSMLLVHYTEKETVVKMMETLSMSTKQLKRPANGDSQGKSTILLVLDEIDFLVASRATECYLCKLFIFLEADMNTFFLWSAFPTQFTMQRLVT